MRCRSDFCFSPSGLFGSALGFPRAALCGFTASLCPGLICRCPLTFVVLLVLTASSAIASGEPETGIVVLPQTIVLNGPQSSQRLLVEFLSDGRFVGVPNATGSVSWSSADPDVVRVEAGVVWPVHNGAAAITATVDGRTASAQVEVQGMDKLQQWEFRRHVLPILSKAGCNSGACHGALAGKGGFKLSLRGYNPAADHFSITRQARGRRIELADPGRSLLLAKPSASIPHKGGLRLDTRSADYQVLATWIAAGAPAPTDFDPQLERIEVLPAQTSLTLGNEQPLIVRAHYSDGRIDDVTRWAKYSATNEAVAKVDDQGQHHRHWPWRGRCRRLVFQSDCPFSRNSALRE